jgi:ribonuclease R
LKTRRGKYGLRDKKPALGERPGGGPAPTIRIKGPGYAGTGGAHGGTDRPASSRRRGDDGPAGGRGDSQGIGQPGKVVEGVVSAHRAGYGFVRVEGMKDNVFLPPNQMRGVMHGDRLRVRLQRDASNRWLGTVEQIVNRGVTAFLGTIEVEGRGAWVNSTDRRLQLRCAVSHADLNGARAGDWVIARITRYASHNSPANAKVEKVLDPDRPVELATESAIARFDLPTEFSGNALRDAHAWGESVDPAESAVREDLRQIPLVTIDGEDAKDFDDAVYAEPHPSGFRLIVAIADVSHYVRPGTALDNEA